MHSFVDLILAHNNPLVKLLKCKVLVNYLLHISKLLPYIENVSVDIPNNILLFISLFMESDISIYWIAISIIAITWLRSICWWYRLFSPAIHHFGLPYHSWLSKPPVSIVSSKPLDENINSKHKTHAIANTWALN